MSISDAAEEAALLALERASAPILARALAACEDAVRAHRGPLPELIDETHAVHHACTTAAEARPVLAGWCERLWQRCAAAITAHPTAVRARRLAAPRYAALEQRAHALAAADGVPAELVLELALGSAPLPFGPSDDRERAHGRTGYAPTPIATAVAAIDALELAPHDTFCDLGAGVGLPTCIAALRSEAACLGIEIHARYAERAADNARRLGLANARFVTGDATAVELPASKFFMFNPFPPPVLAVIVERLAAMPRPVRVACVHVELPGLRPVASTGPLRIYEV